MYVLAPNQTVEKFPYSIGDLRKDNPQTSFPKNPSDELLASYNVFPVVSTSAQFDSSTQVAEPNGCTYNADKQRWETAWTVRDKRPDEIPTQFELDQRRYQKRAAVQSELIAWMAADNMSRVRSGVWTVADLTSLMSDPAVVAANAYMQTLSYELAAQSIADATTQLLTPEIKSSWIGKLQEHFYLVP
jgi:hypothetical protein